MNKIVISKEHKGFKYYVKFFDILTNPTPRSVISPCYEGYRWYCGYVEIPANNKLYNKNYIDLDFDVHGGLTFAGELEDTGTYCIGFDCNHWGDNYIKYNAAYTENECIKLIEQIIVEG